MQNSTIFGKKLGHVLACKIGCNQRKKNPSFNYKSILSKSSEQNFNKIGALVFEKLCPLTSKYSFEKTAFNELYAVRRPKKSHFERIFPGEIL